MNAHTEPEQLSAYLDGELTEREQVTLEAHVAGCADCSRTLVALRATMADLGALGEPALDETTSWAIRSAVAREERLSARGRRFTWAAGAAAASLLAILSFIVVSQGDSSDRAAGGAAEDAAGTGTAFNLYSLDANLDEALLQGRLESVVVERGIRLAGSDQAGPLAARDAAASPQANPHEFDPAQAGNGGGQTPAPMTAPMFATDMRQELAAEDPERERALACLRAIAPDESKVRVIEALAARYKSEPAFVYFFEAPADRPRRIELWVVARASCEVRYFRQARIPPE